MKKPAFFVLFIGIFSMSWPQSGARAEPSGIYQEILLGADPSRGVVTGYYRELFQPPNLPYVECAFYLFGKKEGDHYAIQAWSPQDKHPQITTGTLSFFSTNPKKPTVLLRLEKLNRDCMTLKPNLTKGQGVYFDLKKSGAWTEVRMVAHPKSAYYQAPNLSSPTRDFANRGTVLTVVARQSDWAQVQSNQKTKGWIQETDLYPMTPQAESTEPAPPVAEKKTVPSSKSPAPSDLPEKPAPLNSPAVPKPPSESKEVLIARLQTLNAQAFEIALQVMKDPTKRTGLSAKRGAMEKDLNSLVAQLNEVSPSAYAEQSQGIIETFLDLRYVEQAQPLTSPRLNKRIQEIGE